MGFVIRATGPDLAYYIGLGIYGRRHAGLGFEEGREAAWRPPDRFRYM